MGIGLIISDSSDRKNEHMIVRVENSQKHDISGVFLIIYLFFL